MTTTSEVLRRVLTRLGENGENWCQGVMALAASGRETNSRSRFAVKWSLPGAFNAETVNTPSGVQFDARERLAEACGVAVSDVMDFNDTHTWPEIKASLKRAMGEG